MNRKQSLRESYAAKCRREGRTPSLKRSPLRRQSRKAKQEAPARTACCRAVRERAGGRCEVRVSDQCTGEMHHTHEITPRGAGGSITDPENCLAACFFCHQWIHDHSNAARTKGLLKD